MTVREPFDVEEFIDKATVEEEWSDIVNYAYSEPMIVFSKEGLIDIITDAIAAYRTYLNKELS